MDEANDTCPNPQPLLSDALIEREQVINEFWDIYAELGVVSAAAYFHNEVKGNIPVTQALVPMLVAEGYKRGENMMEFLQVMQEEDTDANSDADNAGRVPAVGDNEDDNPQDEDESAEERADDTGADSRENDQG